VKHVERLSCNLARASYSAPQKHLPSGFSFAFCNIKAVWRTVRRSNSLHVLSALASLRSSFGLEPETRGSRDAKMSKMVLGVSVIYAGGKYLQLPHALGGFVQYEPHSTGTINCHTSCA
jgi:hypothetical protein